ncbi:aromatic-ring-hydroxylating dioxygenase subunit beta [Gordonia sputi]|uniref:Putative aromatic-ring-hydroxylating dioxygenase beta subunit n=1 Tax=Gordonia sputi NBRC 100414 TaxID=1089453 RepID=H5TXZ3_9ACTN|nr:aromatic-ring-hydroxylating dioxygenase subunit beta [Gordonia sputi]NKY93067.1 aromatic-ring-hydroxylating dioxygenase subunit beta [Gordonia sputi]GAB38351.1 putative aromatic-ring-hydroxylating dioxygenase beta subunit [Gordonia sputi NBRC 100414]
MNAPEMGVHRNVDDPVVRYALDTILRDSLESTYIDDDYYAKLRHDLVEWDTVGTPLTPEERNAYEALVLHESWLLDRRAFEQWYQLYSRQCLYWVPAVRDMPDPEAGDPQKRVTIAFDDRRRMGDRIVWLRTGVAYSQLPPSYTTHVNTGFVRIATDNPDEVKIRSQFIVHEMRDGHTLQAVPGWMGHVFIREDGELKIDRKISCLVDGHRSHHNLTFLI